MSIKALIFDVDGTLADTERDGHRPAFNLSFADAGLDWHWSPSLYGELLEVTGGKERIAHYLARHRPEFSPLEGPLETFIAKLHREKTRHYLELLGRGEIPLRPGVARLLREARDAGVILAIATTTTPENVVGLLRATLGEESVSWFQVIAAGDVVPAKKPAPDIFTYALSQLGLRADECLAIEDSGNGLAAASAAELRTLVTINDYTRDHDFTGACAVIDHLGDAENPCHILRGDSVLSPQVTIEGLRACLQR
ncbi:phosphatase [Acidihalobacter yilgarnensis]|uniref:Phosphatase n=1 Tax=Acidihalobacter yilgarnensis TaxID=2819280 RepID=A0A1D8IND1_9GAMM|nr:HAD family hydrolase [Acidihalobacter yilgarnensis]AOU97935.1 phosphatase [Acidihalobacter yilgarnensis]